MAWIRAIVNWSGAAADRSIRLEGGAPCAAEMNRESIATGEGVVDSGVRVVADAVIDNAAELCATLDLPAQATVTELLRRGFERWGTELPRRLVGDFAFVIWDSRMRSIFAARDPFGVRALVYRCTVEGLSLASDVEQLLPDIPRPWVPDPVTVFEYLTWDYQERDRTFIADIRRLPAGHYLLATESHVRIVPYWEPPTHEIERRDVAAYHEEFRNVFRQAVKDRITSSRPVLVQLSGGIDSSSVVCVAAEIAQSGFGATVKAVSAEFPGLACDEKVFIDAVRRKTGVVGESWDGTRSIASDLADPTLAWPAGRTNMAGGTRGDLDIAVRDGASTILSGSGGDQIGSSDGILRDLGATFQWKRLLSEVALNRSGTPREKLLTIVDSLSGLAPPWSLRLYRHLRSDRRRAARPSQLSWLSASIRRAAAQRSGDAAQRPATFCSQLQKRRWLSLNSPALGWSIERQQRLSAIHGVESRFPFLDVRVARFVLAMPSRFWPPGAYPERLHRSALAECLPAEILARRTKSRFGDALSLRLRLATDDLDRLFTLGSWASGDYVDRREAQKLLAASRDPASVQFWTRYYVWQIATLEAWLRGLG